MTRLDARIRIKKFRSPDGLELSNPTDLSIIVFHLMDVGV